MYKQPFFVHYRVDSPRCPVEDAIMEVYSG
jgi:hypothetical protein